jgi:hypothetical protein
MLTPMLTQYLVGLCCLRANPEAVNVTLGDMVLDPAAKKKRDVDVTVTVEESPGVLRAFMAYEVKKEKTPLGVDTVEQLSIKLKDMTGITHRAIVSASGFSDGAENKAVHHGVELYDLQRWTRPLEEEFPDLGFKGRPEECIKFGRTLLYWLNPFKFNLSVSSGPTSFEVQLSDSIVTGAGGTHAEFSNFQAFREALLFRSTGILISLEPAGSVMSIFPFQEIEGSAGVMAGPAWPHTHTLETMEDNAHLVLDGKPARIERVTISGQLQWQRKKTTPEYYLLKRVSDGVPYVAAMAALGEREGEMFGLALAPSIREFGVHNILLEKRHLNMIRQLKIEIPNKPNP